jgi:hypothetical protein
MTTKKKKEYSQRDDFEKIQAQWTKLTGLHDREEWSAAVIRAATAVELAANVVIRSEFKARGKFDKAFIDSLLMWANGLGGKIDKLITPLWEHHEPKTMKERSEFLVLAKEINKERNDIAHRGVFYGAKKAATLIGKCKVCVEGLVRPYNDDFSLKDPKDAK